MSGRSTRLPDWQYERLVVLGDALGPVAMSNDECASLVWLAGQELPTVENIAAVIRRSRGSAT